MKKAVNIFLLAFYTLGTLVLPLGDFSTLKELPEMYRHCKATEDKDLTPFDFVTDHLINIDGLFDQHKNGDEQKPHSPIQNLHNGYVIFAFIPIFPVSLRQFHMFEVRLMTHLIDFTPSDYVTKLFRPPIFA